MTAYFKKHSKQNQSPSFGLYKEDCKQIPGLKQAHHQTRNTIPIFRDEMSLQKLLKPFSPYREDFMPGYRAITNPPLG